MSAWPTQLPFAQFNAPLPSAQKRRLDEESCELAKRSRYVPAPNFAHQQLPQQPHLGMMGQPPPQAFVQPQPPFIAEAPMQLDVPPPPQMVVCDTRSCPPCFAHRFCRPGTSCLVVRGAYGDAMMQ